METSNQTMPSGETRIDEYLWPLTGDESAVDWEALAEELRLRNRLAEILSLVRERHVEPRLRRLTPGAYANTFARTLTAAVVVGPVGAPPWEQALADPVPQRLRDEWTYLAHSLRTLALRRNGRRQPQSLVEPLAERGGASAGNAGHAGLYAR